VADSVDATAAALRALAVAPVRDEQRPVAVNDHVRRLEAVGIGVAAGGELGSFIGANPEPASSR
jgi:hypothetical protein